jgi:hypothetical protein
MVAEVSIAIAARRSSRPDPFRQESPGRLAIELEILLSIASKFFSIRFPT